MQYNAYTLYNAHIIIYMCMCVNVCVYVCVCQGPDMGVEVADKYFLNLIY